MGKDEERAVTPFKKTIFILLSPASIVQQEYAQDYESLSPAACSALHVCASLPRPFQIWAHPIYYVLFPSISSWIWGSQICSGSPTRARLISVCWLQCPLPIGKGGSENPVILHTGMRGPQLPIGEVSSSPPYGLGNQGFWVRFTQVPILISSRTRARGQDYLLP